jgi:hypothetical protein
MKDAMALTSSDWKGRSFNISVSRIIAPPIKFYAGRACLRSDHAVTPTLPLVMLGGAIVAGARKPGPCGDKGGGTAPGRSQNQVGCRISFLRAAMIISGAPSDLGLFSAAQAATLPRSTAPPLAHCRLRAKGRAPA